MSKITTRINQTLKEMGISKEEFYEKCKITSSAYSQWNTEKTEPKASSLKRISDFLNVSYQWLQFGTGEKIKSPPSDIEDGQEAELLSLIRKLTPDQRQRQIEVLRDIVGYSDK